MEFSRPTVAEMLGAARDEQKELFEWLKRDRRQDTLSRNDAENLYKLFIMHGYSTIKSLANMPWSVVENMVLSQALMSWLSVWLPKSYNVVPHLIGYWEDGMGGRPYTIRQCNSEDFNKYIVEEQDSNRNSGCISLDCVNQDIILLKAPWGKNGNMLEWKGEIEQNGMRIRWQGKHEQSFWYKVG